MKNKHWALPESLYKTLFTTVTERKGQECFSCLQKEYFPPWLLLHINAVSIYRKASYIITWHKTAPAPPPKRKKENGRGVCIITHMASHGLLIGRKCV